MSNTECSTQCERTLKVNKDDEVIIFQVIPSAQVIVFYEIPPSL